MSRKNPEDLEKLIDYLQVGAERIGALDTRLTHVETSIKKYDRIVTDGNGQPSILSQLAAFSAELEHVSQRLDERATSLTTAIEKSSTERRADRRVRWTVTGALICSIIAAITAIVVAISK